jgi:hypothetical protein
VIFMLCGAATVLWRAVDPEADEPAVDMQPVAQPAASAA